jgi:hypothetical protein
MKGSQCGTPTYFGKGKSNAATTATMTKNTSQRTKYSNRFNFCGNNVFMVRPIPFQISTLRLAKWFVQKKLP